MEKILKNYTTIPQHLYVNRNADIELKRIVEEMQRPGYVLVARQMGKTNLLFNAKRTLENEHRLFAYVDLSNLYDNEVDCYRNIINNIIEPNMELFGSIEVKIENIRDKKLPPHNEYSRCLRIILEHYTGDLVIILDEIDALKSIGYSDNIFAQIRSNYFSRTNFPVFERLTYILSGVIEPTELIKDKNKSPFNIGEKIYLDDFTFQEHVDFLKKSNLDISEDISNAIFSWTNGNPRLTFDVCSEVENIVLNKGNVTKTDIDDIIKLKYLTTFDVAPIDHIRELVMTSRQIRKSIESIHKQNFQDLNDEIKKRLYLYGIINSKFDEPTKIKNRIIASSLSKEWIKSIEDEKEVSLVYGLAKYDSKLYEDAIDIFNRVISNTNSSKGDIESSYYFVGLSYFKLQNFREAIKYFTHEFTDESYLIDIKSYLGICKIAIGEKTEGVLLLEESIKREVNRHSFYNALLNLAINTEDEDKAYSLFSKLFECTFGDSSEKEEELGQLRTLACYYQSIILREKGDKLGALEKVKIALEHSNLSYSIYLKCLLYDLEDHKNESFKADIVNIIINNNLQLDSTDNTPLTFDARLLLYLLDLVFDQLHNELFDRLLNYSLEQSLINFDRYETIHAVSLISTDKKDALLDYLLKYEEYFTISMSIKVYSQKLGLLTKNRDLYLDYFSRYFAKIKENDSINNDDIYLFAVGIKFYSDLYRIDEALNLCKEVERKLSKAENDELKFESVIIYYWYANLYFGLKNRENTIKYVDHTLDLIKNSNKKNTSMIDEKGLKTITEQLIQIKRSTQASIPIVNSLKFGRNDKVKVQYSDGNVIEKKYKHVEADILAERCTVLIN